MPLTLDLRATRCDLRVHKAKAAGITLTWPTTRSGHTYTARWGEVDLSVETSGSSVTVAWSESQATALTGATDWELTDGTDAVLVGSVVPSERQFGTRTPSSETTLRILGELVTVTPADGVEDPDPDPSEFVLGAAVLGTSQL